VLSHCSDRRDRWVATTFRAFNGGRCSNTVLHNDFSVVVRVQRCLKILAGLLSGKRRPARIMRSLCYGILAVVGKWQLVAVGLAGLHESRPASPLKPLVAIWFSAPPTYMPKHSTLSSNVGSACNGNYSTPTIVRVDFGGPSCDVCIAATSAAWVARRAHTTQSNLPPNSTTPP
jgi:hypothetical protein